MKSSKCFIKIDPNLADISARAELCNTLNTYNISIERYIKEYNSNKPKVNSCEVVEHVIDETTTETSIETNTEISIETNTETSIETNTETSNEASSEISIEKSPEASNIKAQPILNPTSSPKSTLKKTTQTKRKTNVEVSIEETDFNDEED